MNVSENTLVYERVGCFSVKDCLLGRSAISLDMSMKLRKYRLSNFKNCTRKGYAEEKEVRKRNKVHMKRGGQSALQRIVRTETYLRNDTSCLWPNGGGQ